MTQPKTLLATPLTLPNGSVLPNRLAKSALSESLGTYDNRVTPALPTLFGRWAAGGSSRASQGRGATVVSRMTSRTPVGRDRPCQETTAVS